MFGELDNRPVHYLHGKDMWNWFLAVERRFFRVSGTVEIQGGVATFKKSMVALVGIREKGILEPISLKVYKENRYRLELELAQQPPGHVELETHEPVQAFRFDLTEDGLQLASAPSYQYGFDKEIERQVNSQPMALRVWLGGVVFDKRIGREGGSPLSTPIKEVLERVAGIVDIPIKLTPNSEMYGTKEFAIKYPGKPDII